MTNKYREEKAEQAIREIVNQAIELQHKGEWEKGLKLLKEAQEKTKLLPEDKAKPLRGLIRHYQGRILQAMGKYDEAVERLKTAIELRKEDPIGYSYSMFQLYICKDYGGILISPEEVKETKIALWELIDASQNPKEIGDAFQNLAYVESKQGEIRKAIWLYQVTEVFRGIANDQRGFGLTWARLGECYKKIGEGQKTQEYGDKALRYFEEIGDIERIQQVKKNVFGEEKI
ncbi:tetratricopeptide repeat protein [Patescibacteria group bacterium]|nr:tetratricopeptide repeat protein [Patescibacteria group bacterium]